MMLLIALIWPFVTWPVLPYNNATVYPVNGTPVVVYCSPCN